MSKSTKSIVTSQPASQPAPASQTESMQEVVIASQTESASQPLTTYQISTLPASQPASQPKAFYRPDEYYANLDKAPAPASQPKSQPASQPAVNPVWTDNAQFTTREYIPASQPTTMADWKKLAKRYQHQLITLCEVIVTRRDFAKIYESGSQLKTCYVTICNLPESLGGNAGDTANYKGKHYLGSLVTLIASQKRVEYDFKGYLASQTESGLSEIDARIKAESLIRSGNIDKIKDTRKAMRELHSLHQIEIVEKNRKDLQAWHEDTESKAGIRAGKDLLSAVKRESRAFALWTRIQESFCSIITGAGASFELTCRYWELVNGKPVKRTSPDKLYVSESGFADFIANRVQDTKFVELIASQPTLDSDGNITSITSIVLSASRGSNGGLVWTPNKRKSQSVKQYESDI
jgi:hypothetical protein